MPGMVTKVFFYEGDAVDEGDVLVAIEAMKMETVIRAERGGVVEKVVAPAGTTVDTKDLLVVVGGRLTRRALSKNDRSRLRIRRVRGCGKALLARYDEQSRTVSQQAVLVNGQRSRPVPPPSAPYPESRNQDFFNNPRLPAFAVTRREESARRIAKRIATFETRKPFLIGRVKHSLIARVSFPKISINSDKFTG